MGAPAAGGKWILKSGAGDTFAWRKSDECGARSLSGSFICPRERERESGFALGK